MHPALMTIDASQRTRVMGDDNDNSAALAHAEDGARQCRFAIRVQIGVWFIEHKQERIAVESPGQGDSLLLSG
jgi:hypothetical protein